MTTTDDLKGEDVAVTKTAGRRAAEEALSSIQALGNATSVIDIRAELTGHQYVTVDIQHVQHGQFLVEINKSPETAWLLWTTGEHLDRNQIRDRWQLGPMRTLGQRLPMIAIGAYLETLEEELVIEDLPKLKIETDKQPGST